MNAFNQSEAITETIGHLAARWEQPDKSILRAVFPLLASGGPVVVEQIAKVTGAEAAVVETALRLGWAERNTKGWVTELFGITTAPTTHRIEIKGVVLYSCCALVAQMVPLLVDHPARIETVDPISRQLVRVEITPDKLTSIDPPEAWGTFVRTELETLQKNVGEAFCQHIHNFISRETAEQYAQQDKRRYILNMEIFHDVARQLTRAVWGD
ncbi:organomercurial lyase [Candidatus Neomarinimicrobiota bacterium]